MIVFDSYIGKLHELAIEISDRYLKSEAELIDILQKLDSHKAYQHFECTSLYDYCLKYLKLSEDRAYALISIARKAKTVPALKQEIKNQTITVSNARRIAPILTAENQSIWLEKAKILSQRELEKELRKEYPKEATPEKATYITETRLNLSLSVSEELMKALRRIQDLESQRTKKAASLEEALEAMTKAYLEKHDPIEKAKRAEVRKQKTEPSNENSSMCKNAKSDKSISGARPVEKREPIYAALKHQVTLRDQIRCAHIDSNGKRCSQKRWLEIHHIKPVSEGGKNILQNLITYCSTHHQKLHGR